MQSHVRMLHSGGSGAYITDKRGSRSQFSNTSPTKDVSLWGNAKERQD